jgi:hypothetical protein
MTVLIYLLVLLVLRRHCLTSPGTMFHFFCPIMFRGSAMIQESRDMNIRVESDYTGPDAKAYWRRALNIDNSIVKPDGHGYFIFQNPESDRFVRTFCGNPRRSLLPHEGGPFCNCDCFLRSNHCFHITYLLHVEGLQVPCWLVHAGRALPQYGITCPRRNRTNCLERRVRPPRRGRPRGRRNRNLAPRYPTRSTRRTLPARLRD